VRSRDLPVVGYVFATEATPAAIMFLIWNVIVGLSDNVLRAVPGSLDSRSGACRETAQHEADHRETNEGSRLSGVALVVACKPTTTADPRQCSFDNPSVREHHEAMPVTAADDLEHPRAGPRDSSGHFPALIARVSDDAFEKGKAPSRLSQQSLGSVPILHAGGMDVDGHSPPANTARCAAWTASSARSVSRRIRKASRKASRPKRSYSTPRASSSPRPTASSTCSSVGSRAASDSCRPTAGESVTA
jgi:hypothetical protein